MKRFYWIFLISFVVLSGAVILFSMLTKKDGTVPETMTQAAKMPVFYLMDEEQAFNPMLPYKTKMDLFSMYDSMAFYEQNGMITLYVDVKEVTGAKYSIYDQKRKELITNISIQEQNKTDYLQGQKMTVSLEGLEVGSDYLLMISSSFNGFTYQYYQPFSIGPNKQGELIGQVLDLHNAMMDQEYSYNKGFGDKSGNGTFYHADIHSDNSVLMWEGLENSVQMNESIPKIIYYQEENGAFRVELNFVVANLNGDYFEYWDFQEIYTGYVTQFGIDLQGFERTGSIKNDPHYDVTRKKWVFDEGELADWSDVLVSPSGIYTAMAYDHKVWLMNTTTNTLTKVFGFGQMDGDYIIDESKDNGLRLLEVDDEGNVSYLIYGYISTGKMRGNNGIMHNVYNINGNVNQTNFFLELNYSYSKLKYTMEQQFYFDPLVQYVHFILDCNAYILNLNEKECIYIDELPAYTNLSDQGFLYSVDTTGKDNMGLKAYDLTSSELSGQTIYAENKYLRPIGVLKGQLVLGLYELKKTYERKNGEVFYPYDMICLISGKGEILSQFLPPEGEYFGDAVINPYQGSIIASVVGIQLTTMEDPVLSTISYELLDEQVLVSPSQTSYEPLSLTIEELNGRPTIISKYSAVTENNQLRLATNSTNSIEVITLRIRKERQIFEAYSENELIGASIRLEEVIPLTNGRLDGLILKKEKDKRTIIYEQSAMKRLTDQNIPVAAISQTPELPRGSGVTALSMFLNYYLDQVINKSTLSFQLIKDSTSYRTGSGMITYGDMHKGFVGSMDSLEKQGLGVYIEPLKSLAQEYMDDNIVNMTGCSFDQLLYNISTGIPSIVIVSTSFGPVTNATTQTWSTSSGYMEVETTMHTVVLVGYDQSNVYFNDPLTGTLQSAKKEDFKKGWEQMGNQALSMVAPY